MNTERAELTSLFFETFFSKGDVILATGFSEKALEHLSKPNGPYRFAGGGVQGRAKKYTGHDILLVEVMRQLQFFNVTHHDSIEVRAAVSSRLNHRIGGLLPNPAPEMGLVLYPYFRPDYPDRVRWACVQHVDGAPEPWTAPFSLIVYVDRVIAQVTEKLRALRDDIEMPRFHPLVEATKHAARAAGEGGNK